MAERSRIYKDSYGVKKTMIWEDDDPNKFVIKTEQDLTEIIDGIARKRDVPQTGDNRYIATLPRIIYEDLVKRGIANDEDAFRKWLNSSEATPWRTWQGSV